MCGVLLHRGQSVARRATTQSYCCASLRPRPQLRALLLVLRTLLSAPSSPSLYWVRCRQLATARCHAPHDHRHTPYLSDALQLETSSGSLDRWCSRCLQASLPQSPPHQSAGWPWPWLVADCEGGQRCARTPTRTSFEATLRASSACSVALPSSGSRARGMVARPYPMLIAAAGTTRPLPSCLTPCVHRRHQHASMLTSPAGSQHCPYTGSHRPYTGPASAS